MKRLLLLILLSFCLSVSAQEAASLPDLFEFSEPLSSGSSLTSKSQNDKMSNRLKNPMNVEIRKVSFKNMGTLATAKQADTLSPGYVTIKIPKKKKKKGFIRVMAIPKQIESYDNGSYLYVAELVKDKNQKGTLIINHKGGQNYGSMTFGKRVFTIESNGVNDDYLIEIDNKKLDNEAACGTDLIPKMDKKNKSGKSTASSSLSARNNGQCNVRVLVLFTDNANAVSNPQQLSNTLMAETNTVLRNSRIYSNNLVFSLVGTQRFAFNDRRDAGLVFTQGRNNAQIRQLREDNNADLVVLLTDGNFFTPGLGTTFGISSLNEFGDAEDGYFAIVEADAGGFTFAHEIAHNLGARHNNDPRTFAGVGINNLPDNLSETAKGHTWYKRNCFFCQKLYRKSVLSTRGTTGIRQPFYSNPDVKAESKARGNTGTSTRNNYRQLLNAARVVAEYDPFQELTVSIGGPSSVRVGNRYTMTSNVNNCAGTTYRWEISYNGFSYFNAGSGATLSQTAVPYNGSQIYYRLRVSCADGQTRTVFRTVYIDGASGGGPQRKSTTEENLLDLENVVEDSGFVDMVLYPNPADNEIFITTNFKEDSKIEVKIIDILKGGKAKKIFGERAFIGPGELRLDISKFDQGLYEVEMYKNGNRILTRRLLISR